MVETRIQSPDPEFNLASYVRGLRKALPPERFKPLVPDKGESTDLDYLTLLVYLQNRRHVGSGDIGHDDLLVEAQVALEEVKAESMDEHTVEARLQSLERWGLIEFLPETTTTVDLRQWRLSTRRYRISADGTLLLRALESVMRQKQRPRSTEDARNLLVNIERALLGIKERLQKPPTGRRQYEETIRTAYWELAEIAENRCDSLKEYLRELTIRIQEFAESGDFDIDELEHIVDRLEQYMENVHSEFRTRSASILNHCMDLYDDELMAGLVTGKALVEQGEQSTPLARAVLLPHPRPRTYLNQLSTYFDTSQRNSLVSEVNNVRDQTRRIISRMRDHWQRILERTAYVQQLDLAWQRLKAIDAQDDVGWNRALEWNAHLFDLRNIPTAPSLGDAANDGRPPGPRRRYVRKDTGGAPTYVKKSTYDAKADLEAEEARALELNALIQKHVLIGQKEALLSSFKPQNHEEFRCLITITKHSNLVLNTALAGEYFEFQVERVHDAPPITWRIDDMEYQAPELRFTHAPKRKQWRTLDA